MTPTLVDGLPLDHQLFREELFVPLLTIGEVLSLGEALELANRTEYGLTAGIFSEDREEIELFFDRIQAGVTFANRRSGATTGAWPGVKPFCGWKASGSSGKGVCGPTSSSSCASKARLCWSDGMVTQQKKAALR